MRYLSLFDGIGAASVAWEPLGWKCVAVSEIDAFPIAVTKHHRPDTPHIGDVTKITEERIAALGRIDLVVGGFPCQDLSVAGKRQGLRNDDGTLTRSGLFYDAIRLVQWARKHCGCRWLLIENVPGLFSSNGGRDFAAVVGAVVGTGFDVPRDGWRNSGAAFGPEGLAEWCTLDAQFFGLAQRRKRVFLVGHFGDWRRAAAVLFDAASLRGDPAPRREAGKTTPTLPSRRTAGGGFGTDFDCDGGLIPAPHADISPAIKARDSKGASSDGDGDGAILVPMVAFSCKDHGADVGEIAPTLRSMGHAGSHANAGGQVAVAFDARQSDVIQYGDKSGPLDTCGFTIGLRQGMQVRRLLPVECEKLQGFPPGYTDVPYRGKPAADGPRYKALGNSMAVPVMRWIGERIGLVERIGLAVMGEAA